MILETISVSTSGSNPLAAEWPASLGLEFKPLNMKSLNDKP